MNPLAIDTLKGSKHLALTAAFVFATLLFAPRAGNTQQLQRGISVQLAVTSNAASMPEADNEDAWIVAVLSDGSMFFGLDRVSPEGLADKMKSRPRRRDQKLYIKADARASFADVRKVLTAAHDTAANEAAFNGAVLLTSQIESVAPGTVVPPKGLEVQIAPHSNAATIVVQVNAGQPPTLEVNDQKIPAEALQDTLRRLLQGGSDTPVLVKTRGPVSFAPVVQVIDACRSIGAKVMLSTPQL
jgi:biopolymer transport protein ExbD